MAAKDVAVTPPAAFEAAAVLASQRRPQRLPGPSASQSRWAARRWWRCAAATLRCLWPLAVVAGAAPCCGEASAAGPEATAAATRRMASGTAGAASDGADAVSAGAKGKVVSPARTLLGGGRPTRAASHTSVDAAPSRPGSRRRPPLLVPQPAAPPRAFVGRPLPTTSRVVRARLDGGRRTEVAVPPGVPSRQGSGYAPEPPCHSQSRRRSPYRRQPRRKGRGSSAPASGQPQRRQRRRRDWMSAAPPEPPLRRQPGRR
ncbi:hypothetical protein I4F81_012682 [Pyropia yezoensis]|uniref:Uncharacterized protein n=1 Tax=Pyropia yezoensis TaxID=2788 RepID=A0ACC3CJG4_PYRYE|nr:hypothetical protein I4F81_012682 [Neopyropia yezoensis]